MKKKVVIVIIVLLVIGVILTLLLKKDNNNNQNALEEPNICITGGGFNIIFNTNGGNNIDNMSVCIACSPDSYIDLPIPEKDGYKFVGWYYDNELKEEVDGTSSIDVEPKSIEKNDCITGYEDIILFAKWEKE